MIVKSFVVLILSVGLISAVTGSSYSNVYVERDIAPKEYYQYGTPYASIGNQRLSQVNALPPVSGYISPCAPPCVLPGQAIAPSANVIAYNAPSLPIIIAPKEDPAGYQYQYVVYDDHTGDHKAQREQSDGSVVRGEYSFLQPDGYIREVQYVADDVSGFNAVVRNFLPVTVEGKKRDENKGHKDSAPDCVEVKSDLKKGSEESEESSQNHGSHDLHENLHDTDSNHHSEDFSEESKDKTKGPLDSANDSQHHNKHQNKSENKSDESGSFEKNDHSELKHESGDVSHETYNKKSKKGSTTESSEESNDDSEEPPKAKHHAISKQGSDESEEESIEKHHKSKKGSKHSDESSEESEESGEQSKERSKANSNSKDKSGHGSKHGSSHESRQESEHGSSHDSRANVSRHGSEHESEHDAGHGSRKHDSEQGSEEKESHEKHKSSQEADEHQVLVPYNDIVRCVMQALKRSRGLPAGMSQEPSALSYLVLNKPC